MQLGDSPFGPANPVERLTCLSSLRSAHDSTENVLASLATKTDADRIRNCDFKTPLLHRRGLHRKALRTRCSAARLVPPISGRLPLVCSSWEKFRDPRETTYTKYTDLPRGKEIFVDAILDEIELNGIDSPPAPSWT